MSQIHAEEFEHVGEELDRTVRTVAVAVAQLAEQLQRRGADNTRSATEALREQVAQAAAAQRQRPASTGGPVPADSQQTQPIPVQNDPVARRWVDSAERMGADPTPENVADHAIAAEELRRHRGVDAAAIVTDALSDTAAAAAEARGSGQVIIPANRANPDRNLAPSMAQTPEEAQHRRQAWAAARETYEGGLQLRGDTAAPGWDQLPQTDQRRRYWDAYDRQEVRTVDSADPSRYGAWLAQNAPAPREVPAPAPVVEERGFKPSEASTPEERDRRSAAWGIARNEFIAALPEGTSEKDANAAWRQTDFKDKLPAYWAAYDQIERPQPPAPTSRERIVELNATAAEFYSARNVPGSPGRAYFEERIGADFERLAAVTGYAGGPAAEGSRGWTQLTDHLRRQGATDQEIVDAGLGTVSSRGNVIDTFRDRAMLGIRNGDNDIVGFVGRDLSGRDGAPKYVNTAATAAFSKGEELYGLAEAQPGARLVRTEGPFDALAVSAASRDGSVAGVAPLGTALTGEQADLLAQRAVDGRVWVALDHDAPGRRAAADDFYQLSRNGLDVREFQYAGASDPAQLWQENPAALTAATERLDQMPSAAYLAVEDTLQRKVDDIRAGDADAFDDLWDAQERAQTAMPESERAELEAFLTDRLSQVTDTASTDRQLAAVADEHSQEHLEEADELREGQEDVQGAQVDEAREQSAPVVSAAAVIAADEIFEHAGPRDEPAARPGPAVAARQEERSAEADHRSADRALSGAAAADTAAARVAVARGAAASGGYDRSNDSPLHTVADPEAVQARTTSAHGYSQPTRAALSGAGKTRSEPATVPVPVSNITRNIGQRPQGPRR